MESVHKGRAHRVVTTLTTSGRHRKEKHLRNNDAYNREEEPGILGGHVDGKE